MAILPQKIPFPYELMKDANFFNFRVRDVVHQDFFSTLRGSHISPVEYGKFIDVCDHLRMVPWGSTTTST
jgi:hypothetical protein